MAFGGGIGLSIGIGLSGRRILPGLPSLTALPAAVTSGATDLVKAAAFQSWWMANQPNDAALFFSRQAATRTAMGTGLSDAGVLTAASADGRWDAVSGRFRPTTAVAHTFTNLNVPGYILVGSSSPLSIAVTNCKFDVTGLARFYTFQRSTPAGTYPVTFTNVEMAAHRTAANDEYGPITFFRCYSHRGEGDAFKFGQSTSNLRSELCWGSYTGQVSTAHGDAWQIDACTDWVILNSVAFSVADPANVDTPPLGGAATAYPPKVPAYTTNTYGPTNAFIIGPRSGNRICTNGLVAGCILHHGGFYQIGVTSQTGETVRDILFAYNVGIHPDFRLAADTALESIYPSLDVAQAGIFENIAFFGNVMPDGTAMKYKGTNVTGIWCFNPTTMSATMIARLKEVGLLDAAGNPVTGAVRSYAAGYTPYTMLHDFETVTGATSTTFAVSLDTSSRKTQGAGAMKLVGNGSNATMSVSAVKTNITTDFSAFDRVLMAIDMGETGFNVTQAFRPDFYVGATGYLQPGSSAGEFDRNVPWFRGKVWQGWDLSTFYQSGNTANPNVKSVGATAKELRVRGIDTIYSRTIDNVVDAAILQTASAFKPTICLTLDDLFVSQYNNLRPDMQRLGLVASIMECSNLIDATGTVKMTQAMINALRGDGYAVCLDSGLSSDSLTSYGTLANAVSTLQANRTSLVTKYGDSEAPNYMCYGSGAIGIKPYGPTSSVYTQTGSISGSTITLSSLSLAQSHLCRGLRVYNAAGTYLGIVTGVNFAATPTVTLDNPPGDAASASLYFCGFVPNLTVSASGTTSVTVTGTDADKVFVGMHMIGYTVPTGTTVSAVTVNSPTSATLTLNNAVPATCVRADFPHLDGEWWPTKTMDALYAAGFKLGRAGASGGGIATPYGIDPRNLLATQALSLVPPGPHLPAVQNLVTSGRDGIYYIHDVTSATMASYWTPLLEGIAAMRDAGQVDVLTLPQYYAKLQARGAFA